MVKSKIVNTINYAEHSKLNLADKGHASCLYIIPILDKEYLVVLGKQNTGFAKEGLVFYPIYLLNGKHKIKAKIGVYEAEVAVATSLLDDDGDVDLTQLDEPLLFSYVNTTYLDTYGTDGANLSAKTMTPEEKEDGKEKDDVEEVDVVPDQSDLENGSDDDDEEDVFTIRKNETAKEDEQEEKKEILTFANVFTKDTHLPTLPTWTSETQEEAKLSRNEYKKKKNTNDNWFVKLLKNKNYIIHENEGAGDCFFATIRDSFAQLGYATTVQRLRAYLSQEVDLALFEQYREIYKGIEVETKTLDHDMATLRKTNVALKKQSDKTDKMEHQKDIVKEALHVKKEFNNKKIQQIGSAGLMDEFGFMKNIHTIEDLKSFVGTAEFWADHWALNTMELLLKAKFIVIENTEDPNQMLRCTEPHAEDFDPTYYIILAYYGNRHYELVSYKDKKIFKFGEIPFDIKKLVVDKCMERIAGVFNRIPSFRQFQTDLGILPLVIDTPENDGSITSGLFDPKLVLSFHSRSDQSKGPGLVPADNIPIIPVNKRNEFAVLSKIKSWRRRLDDSWVGEGKITAPFTTEDSNRWASIEHYMMAVRFKESNPAVYVDFCADTVIGKDLKKAQASVKKKKNDKKDKDKEKSKNEEEEEEEEGKHFEVWKKSSKLENSIRDAYRKEALTAKFTQNLDMSELLRATGMARLEHYVPSNPPFVDIALMEVRASLI